MTTGPSTCTCGRYTYVLVTYLERIQGAKVDWYERQPDYTRRVHGKSYKFGLVEVLGNLSRLHRVDGAYDDQQHIVDERNEERNVFDPTLENDLVASAVGVVVPRAGRFEDHPHARRGYLNGDQDGAEDDLRFGTDKCWTFGGPTGAVEDARDAVGLGEQRGVHGREAEADAEALNGA